MALKKVFLLMLLGLAGLATVITVGMLLLSSSSRAADDAMMSAMSAGYFLLMSFAAFMAFDRKGLRWVAFLGCAVGAMMIVGVPVGMWWLEKALYARDYVLRDLIGELIGTGFVLAGWLCLVPFVLAPRGKIALTVLQIFTAFSIFVSFLLLLIMLWTRNGDRLFERLVPASFVLSGAGILAVFVLNKFFGIKVKDVLTTVGQLIFLKCPRCQREQEIPIGDAACKFCQLKFRIEVEEPRCPKCGYNLHQLTRPICPECGSPLAGAGGIAMPAPGSLNVASGTQNG